MLEKLKKALTTLIENVSKVSIAKGNVWIIYVALLLLFGTIVTYIATWCWLCFWKGTAGLDELREIIVILCGAPFLSALCFLTRNAVDKDGDGYSDNINEVQKLNGK